MGQQRKKVAVSYQFSEAGEVVQQVDVTVVEVKVIGQVWAQIQVEKQDLVYSVFHSTVSVGVSLIFFDPYLSVDDICTFNISYSEVSNYKNPKFSKERTQLSRCMKGSEIEWLKYEKEYWR